MTNKEKREELIRGTQHNNETYFSGQRQVWETCAGCVGDALTEYDAWLRDEIAEYTVKQFDEFDPTSEMLTLFLDYIYAAGKEK